MTLTTIPASAQTEYSTWIFGENVRLEFRDANGVIGGTPIPFPGPPIGVREGSMAYSFPCDETFSIYAMGETVSNADGSVVLNGAGLTGGGSSSQGGLFVRDLERSNSVYLYVTPDMTDISSTGTQQYARNRLERLIDGKWMNVERSTIVDPRPGSERISATNDASGTGYWVVLQFSDTAASTVEFRAYHHTPSGIAPVAIVSRFVDSTLHHQAGMLKFSPDGTKLAMTSVGETSFRLYDFNAGTGRISRARKISMRRPSTVSYMALFFGLSFSMNSANVFLSCRATPVSTNRVSSCIVRISTAGLTTNTPIIPEIIFAGQLHNTYPAALQLGPNGFVYFTNNTFIGEIRNPDSSVSQPADVDQQSIVLPFGSRSIVGLPTCIESTYRQSDTNLICDPPGGRIQATDTCEGNCVIVTSFITNRPTSWRWSFPGGTPSVWSGPSPPPICYPTPGVYPIQLIASNVAGDGSMRDSVRILAKPFLDAGPDLVVCMDGPIQLRASSVGAVEWREATTGIALVGEMPIVRCDVPTTYIVRSSEGCTEEDSVHVTITDSIEVVQSRISVCRGGAVRSVLLPDSMITWDNNGLGVQQLDDSTYSFKPTTDGQIFSGLVRWPDRCAQRIQVSSDIIDKRVVHLAIESASGHAGDTLSIPMLLQADILGGRATVTLPSIEGMQWVSEFGTEFTTSLDRAEIPFTARAFVLLNGRTVRELGVKVVLDDTCSVTTIDNATLTVEQCGGELRQVSFTTSLEVQVVGREVEIKGQGTITATICDVLGTCHSTATLSDHGFVAIDQNSSAPIFIVVRSGAQQIVRRVR